MDTGANLDLRVEAPQSGIYVIAVVKAFVEGSEEVAVQEFSK